MPQLATISRVAAVLLAVIAAAVLTGCPMAPPANPNAVNGNADNNAADNNGAADAIALVPGNIERVPPQTQPVALPEHDETALRGAIERMSAAVRDADGSAFYAGLAGRARVHINATLIRTTEVVDDAVRRERLSAALEAARDAFTPYDQEAALNVLADVTRDGERHVWVRVDGAGDGALHFVVEDGQWRFMPRLPSSR